MKKGGPLARPPPTTSALENLSVGDIVLVHAGFAIEKLMSEEASEIEALWDTIRAFAEQ